MVSKKIFFLISFSIIIYSTISVGLKEDIISNTNFTENINSSLDNYVIINLYVKSGNDLTNFEDEGIIMDPNNWAMFKISIKNIGNSELNSIVVTDILPPELTYVLNFTPENPSFINLEKNTIYWNFTHLSPGECKTIIFGATVSERSCMVWNTANVTAEKNSDEIVYDEDTVYLNFMDYIPVIVEAEIYPHEDQLEVNLIAKYGYLYCWDDTDYHTLRVDWRVIKPEVSYSEPFILKIRVREWIDNEPAPLLQFMIEGMGNIKTRSEAKWEIIQIPLDQGEISGSSFIDVRLKDVEQCELSSLTYFYDTRVGWLYYVWGGYEIYPTSIPPYI